MGIGVGAGAGGRGRRTNAGGDQTAKNVGTPRTMTRFELGVFGASAGFAGSGDSARPSLRPRTHVFRGLVGHDARAVKEEAHGVHLERLAGAEGVEDLARGGWGAGGDRGGVSGDREKRRGGGRRGARGGRRREARRSARTFSNLVVCFTLKCTSELSCDGAAPRREGQSAFVRIRHRARVLLIQKRGKSGPNARRTHLVLDLKVDVFGFLLLLFLVCHDARSGGGSFASARVKCGEGGGRRDDGKTTCSSPPRFERSAQSQSSPSG